jgi:hypothetical protein
MLDERGFECTEWPFVVLGPQCLLIPGGNSGRLAVDGGEDIDDFLTCGGVVVHVDRFTGILGWYCESELSHRGPKVRCGADIRLMPNIS